MKFGTTRPRSKVNDRITRWIGFLALAALLAMATLPVSTRHPHIAAGNTAHWSDSWHG
ncbi:MAG: hypothetical protein R3D05_01160 [Dongiaceae bacterium]